MSRFSPAASDLTEITPERFGVDLRLAYATADNVTGRPIYSRPACYLHSDAADKLRAAVGLAGALGLRLRLFDAFRPIEAQRALFDACPDPGYVSDPRTGAAPHCRGVAVDLTLIDREGAPLEMGVGFDDFTPRAHHASTEVSAEAQRNRFLLLGMMSAAGWDFHGREWWHYQLFDPRRYPILSNGDIDPPMMG